MVPEALLFPANKIELKVKSLLETSGQWAQARAKDDGKAP